ncbi:MAG: cysteine desulfurase family protein [Candidatus Bathyarchaeia archaeon]|jgi:cysteine desulfurase|nr:cysteine desulfurase [Candidatus Bathyarchaeota archaeon A05DMB-4]MDH7595147.1 cysteine desulfurase family protein [Candidatus Bathyarchaeota archaeon]
MSTKRIYMDHTAGMPVDPRVIEATLPYMNTFFGNPSSLHSFGQEPRKAMEEARAKVAELINAERKESIIFTSGATESNNLAIKGYANRNRTRGTHIITSSIEHMSVLNPVKYLSTHGFKTTFLPVDQYGFVSLENLEKELTDETILVSIMYANGEIGTIQPIKEISQIVHRKKAVLHVDATAAAGQVPIDVQAEGIDMLTISSNDMYGPKGVGALYFKKGVVVEPLIHGGGQELGLRSGTENVPSIVGFGKAAELAKTEMQTESERLTRLRDRFIKGLVGAVPYSFLNGHPTKRLPNNVAVRYSFIEGESMLLSLDMLGIAASSGSACTAKTLEPSHVLRAIGLKHEEAHGSLLFTLGKQNTEEEVDYVVSVMPDIVKRLRSMSPLTPKELKE